MSPKTKLKKISKSAIDALKKEELFDASPLPDRFSSPKVNKIAKSVFNAPPGSNPILPESGLDALQSSCPETPTVELPKRVLEMESNKDITATTDNAAPQAISSSVEGIKSPPEKAPFAVGDVVWAQTDVQFPFWPAYVIDPAHLPEDLQQAYHFTAARNGKSNKIPVYFYGRNDYDVVTPARMKDYAQHRDALKNQSITGSLYVVFRRGVRLADDILLKEPALRMEWMLKGRSDSLSSKDGNPTISRTTSSSTHSSRSNSRASSMMITTSDAHDVPPGVMSAGGAALQMSPLSDTPNSGLFSTGSAEGGRGSSRFTFPEHQLPVSVAPQLETVTECSIVTPETPPVHPPLFSAQVAAAAAEPVSTSTTDTAEVVDAVEAAPQSPAEYAATHAPSVETAETVEHGVQEGEVTCVPSEEPTAGLEEHTTTTADTAAAFLTSAGTFLTAPCLGDDTYEIVDLQVSTPAPVETAQAEADTTEAAAVAEMEIEMKMAAIETTVEMTEIADSECTMVEVEIEVAAPASLYTSSPQPSPSRPTSYAEAAAAASLFGNTHSAAAADLFSSSHHTEIDMFGSTPVAPPLPLPASASAAVDDLFGAPAPVDAAPAVEFADIPLENTTAAAEGSPARGSPPRSSPVRSQQSSFGDAPRVDPFSAFSTPSREASFFDGTTEVDLDTPGHYSSVHNHSHIGGSVGGPAAVPVVGDAALLFGASLAPPPMVQQARPLPAALTTATTATAGQSGKHADASSLFGNSGPDLFSSGSQPSDAGTGIFSAGVNTSSAAPPRERVTSGGRAAVVSAGKGLFDDAPAAADGLFGSAPCAAATDNRSSFTGSGSGSSVSKKVVVNRAAASDLFGSAAADDSNPFGAPAQQAPPMVPPAARHAPPPTGLPSAVNPFAGPPPSPENAFGSGKSFSAPGFGGSNGNSSNDAASFASRSSKNSPSRPVNDAASLFGDSGASNGGPFGFGPGPGASSGFGGSFSSSNGTASDVFGGAPTPSAPKLAAPEPLGTFGAPPAPAPALVRPPMTMEARPLESDHLTSESDSHFDSVVLTPNSAHGGETSGECVSPLGADADTSAFFGASKVPTDPPSASATPAVRATTAGPPPVVPERTPFASTSTKEDLFTHPPALPAPAPAPVSLLVPEAATRAASAPVEPTTATATTVPAVSAPTLNRNSTGGPVFKGRAKVVAGASPFDAVSTANTADVLFGPPGGASAPGPFSTSSLGGVQAAGAAGSLFGAPSAAADPFSSAPVAHDEASAFSTTPASSAAVPASSYGGGVSNIFEAPPPGASMYGAPPNSVAGLSNSSGMSAKRATKGKVPLSASDVFSSAAPVEVKPYAALVDPFSPPTAPGVKVVPKAVPSVAPAFQQGSPHQMHGKAVPAGGVAAADVFSSVPPSPAGVSSKSQVQQQNLYGALPSPVPGLPAPGSPFPGNPEVAGAAPLPPASMSGKYGKPAPVPKAKKAPPPGMIATPHGYVPIASLQPSGASGGGGAHDAPAPAPVPAIASQPLVKHSVLTSLVTETAPEVAEQPPDPADAQETPAGATGISSVLSAVAAVASSAISASTTCNAQAAGRNKHVKPIGPVVSFGFGGKLLSMFPRSQSRNMPVFNPAYAVPAQQNIPLPSSEGKSYTCGPIKVHSVLDLMRSYVRNASTPAIAGLNAPIEGTQEDVVGAAAAVSEATELCKLLTLFPGPLSTQPTAGANSVPAGSDATDTDTLVRDLLQSRIDRPLSRTLKADKRATETKQAELASSEKLLWTLLKLCVDRGGVLISDSGAETANATASSTTSADTLSSEVKVIQLLLGHAPTASASVPGGASVSVFSGSAASSITSYAPDMTKPRELHANFTPKCALTAVGAEQYSEIEALLVVGRREDALKKAVHYGEWSLAILIGSVCGADKYQEVVRSYSASHFPASAPLHLLTLMYTNQATPAVLGANPPSSSSEDALALWRHNLSSILSNKPSNWQQLAKILGYRLQSESKDIFAAHSAYLSAGALPTFPTVSASGTAASSASTVAHTVRGSGNTSTYSSTDSLPGHEQKQHSAEIDASTQKLAGKYSLLGCDVTQAKHRALADCLSISALRGTEVLEYTLLKRLQTQTAAHANGMAKSPSVDGIAAIGTIGKSLTDIFSWSSGSTSSVPPKSPRAGAASSGTGTHASTTGAASASLASAAAAMDAQLKYKVTKVRAVLCPLKVRFAMILADFGLLKEAAAYAMEARQLVQEIGVADDKNKAVDKAGGKLGTAGPPTGPGQAAPSRGRPPGGGNNSNSNTSAGTAAGAGAGGGALAVKQFNRNFVRALDEFIDRLGLSDKTRGNSGAPAVAGASHKREGSTGSGTSTGGTTTSLWGSMISSINLKDLVDNMTDAPPAGAPPLPAGPPPTQHSQHAQQSAGAGAGPPTHASAGSHMWPQHQQHPAVTTSAAGNASRSSDAFNAPPPSAAPKPPPSSQQQVPAGQNAAHYAAMSSMPPRPGGMSVPPPATGEHRAPPAFHSEQQGGEDQASSRGGDDFFEEVDLSQEWKNNPSGGFYENKHSTAAQHHAPHGGHQHQYQDQHSQQHSSPQTGMHSRAPPHSTSGGAPPRPGGQRGDTSGGYSFIPAPILTSGGEGSGASGGGGAPPSMWGGSYPSASGGAHTPNSRMPPQSSHQHQQSHQSQQHQSQQHQSEKNTPGASNANASVPPSTSTGSFFGFGSSTATNSSSTSSPVAPSTSTGAAGGSNGNGNSSAAHTPKAAPATTKAAASSGDEGAGGGLFGAVRKGMLKYLYPDAHDASSNIGKSLEAVYNKETGRWEFPGEEGNGAPSPASLPPPTGPMGMGGGSSSGGNSGTNSLGVSPSPSMSAFGNIGNNSNSSSNMPPMGGGMSGGIAAGGPPGAGAGGGGGAGGNSGGSDYDPMAALMAPPSRRMPSSYSTASLSSQGGGGGGGDVDPLAALMAPPPMSRYSMSMMPPASMAGTTSSNSLASMPSINVWKPPPMTTAAAPVVPAVDSSTTVDTADADSSSGTRAEGPPMLDSPSPH